MIGAGRVLVQIDGARRANSFNYYKKVVGVDAEPVKVINTEGTQVADVFYVTDTAGAKITAPERIEEVKNRILSTVAHLEKGH